MQRRPLFWLFTSLLCLGGAIYFWQWGDRMAAEKAAAHQAPATAAPAVQGGATPATTAPKPTPAASSAAAKSSPTAYRVSNTDRKVNQLLANDRAILLANALIDTTKPLDGLAIPDRLRAPKNSGSYVVVARDPLDEPFRALLNSSGASIISYIPNNAYLVRASEAGIQQLQADPRTASVVAYEPYYKLDSGLLGLAMEQKDLPSGMALNLTLFPDARQETIAALEKLGAPVLSEQRSPFGPVVTVQPDAKTLVALAQLPGVQLLSAWSARTAANDLSRPRLAVALDSITNQNYLGLSGTNVLININDSGVDATHPDLTGRLTGDFTNSLTDANGHGTHVAGTIMGNGSMSSSVTGAPGSVTNANFRGMAYNATAFVMAIGMSTRPGADLGGPFSDVYLQEQAARTTNVFISNNSWNYLSSSYDINAASYDAAVRDALPEVPGSQSLLYVFAAGNNGGGNADGTAGNGDTIRSPSTGKNVITVGAIEALRNLTNIVTVDGLTNQPFVGDTDSSNQVAGFSSRGNVGIGIEGDSGRFKPDVVANGTWVISDRSGNWDTQGYYNPTNYTFNTISRQTVDTNSLKGFSISIPDNALELDIFVTSNDFSRGALPPMPLYVSQTDNPTFTTYESLTTNSVSLLTGTTLNPGGTVFYSVGNTTTQALNFDISTILVTTNDDGDRLTIISNMNESIGRYYRYESGTSMSAAGVSGMLALMQEFYQQRLHVTNSPALMKALLINGARSLGAPYDFQVASTANAQGWGLPSLPNSTPGILTNSAGAGGASLPLQFFDQSLTNALATGQSKTRKLTLNPGATAQALRFTLVWTDPPGNPSAGVKLVNDLDLIVTNLDTGDVFYGNDIPTQSIYSESSDTNAPPITDHVNNVENIFLGPPPIGTNYTVTVFARRVNVNALTANTNGAVQDYALVVSTGDAGEITNAFTMTDLNPGGPVSNNVPVLTTMTNGIPLLGQHVGANPPYTTNTIGLTSQWSFYVFTNTAAVTNTSYTNVAFITFLPPNLSLPRPGASQEVAPPSTNATRFDGADIDLYVSTDSTLTNLNPVAIANAQKSLTRTGTEKVLYTNSAGGQVYYIGVKSEDQEAAEFGLVGVATQLPFGQLDSNGNVPLTILGTFPMAIPDGAPSSPGQVFVLAITTQPVQVRKIVVTNNVTHERFGDLIGTLTHGQKVVALNNHSSFTNVNDLTETFVYDDSGEKEFPAAVRTDGPGSLQSFVGDQAIQGVWLFSMVDNAPTEVGQENSLNITVEPQSKTNGFTRTIPGQTWFYDFVDVPPGVTNLTVSVGISGANLSPVDLYLRRGDFPTFGGFDKFGVINPPGGSLTIGLFDSPPLNPGRYFMGLYNPSALPVTVNVVWTLGHALAPAQPLRFLSTGNEPLLDDAVTYSANHVGANSAIVSAEVGVRIDHPRESDLVLTLISPHGTRVLLAENRGGADANGYGSGTNLTLVGPNLRSGGPAGTTNSFSTGTNSGTLNVTFDFGTVPQDLRVYYDGNRIFDSGLITGGGTFAINFGPGLATGVNVVMNEGDNTNPNAVWNYAISLVSQTLTYATFSEDTNFASIPIKFAIPPFGTNTAGTLLVTNLVSSFETRAPAPYAAPSVIEGWSVLDTNPVTIVKVPALADTGSNVLALHKGVISQTLPTLAGRSYTLTFAHHGRPALNPISWWKGDGNYLDSADGNQGTPFNGATFSTGEVGQAFSFNGTNAHVRVHDAPNLHFSTALALEAWVYPTSVGVVGRSIIDKWDGAGSLNQRSYGVGIATDGRLQMAISPNGGITGYTSVFSAGTLPVNQWTHLVGTYDGANMFMYVNGIPGGPVAMSAAIFQGTNDFAIGGQVGGQPSGGVVTPFAGLIDEATVYNRALSALEVQDIYAAGGAGKCPVDGSSCLVTANVVLDGVTNKIIGTDAWTSDLYTFTAQTNGTVLMIQPNQDGMLLDSFKLVQNPSPNTANFYLPEESLDKLVGENSQGNWFLEVLDNRVGATNPTPNLVSWQLTLALDNVTPGAIPLTHAIPSTNSVGPHSISYFSVDVPPWALFATNILVTASNAVNLLFNQTSLPGSNATDVVLLTGSVGGRSTLSTNGTPPLLPGQRYYLGVQNTSGAAITFTIEVDFDITTLTNMVPVTNTLAAAGIPRYYQYDVSNGVAASFQLLKLSGNVDLVARKGPPLPDQAGFDYISARFGTNNESIVLVSNSVPVPLSPGRWYLGVFNNDVAAVTYTILATEVGPPTIITLTNGVPFSFSSGPGPALTNFFQFNITQTNSKALFELYGLSGNVDLTLQFSSLPYTPPFFSSSARLGTNNEQIVIRTNLGTNINGSWFLGVPNNDSSNVTYTIRAVVSTNGLLISGVPIGIGVTLPGPGATTGPTLTWPSVDGETYLVQESSNLVTWTTIATVTGFGQITSYTDPTPISVPVLFYRVIQVPGP
ncbi:MAG: Peptidase and in kexin sedolisin [Pedosphaera sp.]|nr:Peptidase and in kexin sedolisin [Pedosphaera sp.]